MGNKRNRRSRRGQSPSLQRELSASEIETSQGNETVIETLSNFENVSSVRDEETVLDSGTQNENEMQVWTQRIADKTNKEVTNLRKEMDEKLEKILKEMKNNRRTQSVPNRRYREQNTPKAGTSKYISNEDGEENATEPENQEREIQDNPFRPSNLNELRTPMQPLNIQNIDLNDSVVMNEDRTQEDYHMVTGATKPLHRQSSNNTTITHNEHLIAEPLNIQQDPVTQIAMAIEKLANRNSQPSLFHPKNTLTFKGKLEMNEKFEYFEDLFHTTLRMQPALTEKMKINHFHAHLRGLALKTFKNIQRTPTTTLEDILVVFRRKYVKPESSASAKHRFHRLVFDPERQKLPDFLEELQESAEKAFGDIARQMIESLLYAKMPPHLKRSINQAYLENGTYEQIVRHLEREMELNGLESEDTGVKTQMAVINKTAEDKSTQQKNATTKKKQQTPKTVPNNTLQDDQCRYCKNTGHKAADCAKLAKRRKLEEDPDAIRCAHCNAPGHEEPTCYFGANMENCPPKWTLTEAQKKLIENYKNSNKHINPKAPRQQPSSSKDLN